MIADGEQSSQIARPIRFSVPDRLSICRFVRDRRNCVFPAPN